MENKLLTIIIPTYNRCEMLNANLQQLYELSISFIFDLVVCNNASTDDTSVVIDEWKDKIPNMRVVNHETNVFYDRNVASGYFEVKTDYCWVLGDSYTIDSNSFSNLLRILEEKKPQALIIGNFCNKGIEDNVYTDANLLLHDMGWYTTKLCSCIISSHFIDQERCKRYYDSDFIHEGVFYDYLANFENINVIATSSINVRSINVGNKRSGGWKKIPFLIFGKHWFSFVMSLPVKYSLENKLHCIKMHDKIQSVFSPCWIFICKITGFCSFNDYKESRPILKYVLSHPLFIYDLISFFPAIPGLLKIAQKINRAYLRRKRKHS